MKAQINIENATILIDEGKKFVTIEFKTKADRKNYQKRPRKETEIIIAEGYRVGLGVKMTEKQRAAYARKFDAVIALDERTEKKFDSMSEGEFLQHNDDLKQLSRQRQAGSSLRHK